MLLYLGLIHLFLLSTASADNDTCIWRDGTTATGYVPCNSGPSGPCCLNGESCLGSGLCYGSIGLVYRGACVNTWGENCLTYCDDVVHTWANLFPCAFPNTGSIDGPQSWWCGAMGTTVCTTNNNSHFITTLPKVATKLLISSVSMPTPSAAAATFTTTMTISSFVSLSTASTNSTSDTSSTPTTDTGINPHPSSTLATCQPSNTASTISQSQYSNTIIGLGISTGTLFFALLWLGMWAYRSQQKQKQQFDDTINKFMMHQATYPKFEGRVGGAGFEIGIGNYGLRRELEMNQSRAVERVELGGDK